MTTIDREALLASCQRALHAVAPKSTIAAYAAIFFSKGHAYAYNCTSNVDSPSPIEDLEFGVEAKPLHDWLKAATNTDVKVTIKDKKVKFQCGRTRIELYKLGFDLYTFDADDFDDFDVKIRLTEEFLEKLAATSKFMMLDDESPELSGVTLVKSDEFLDMYATDTESIATACLAEPSEDSYAINMQPEVVASIVDISKTAKPEELEFNEEFMKVTFEGGTVLLAPLSDKCDPEWFVDFCATLDEEIMEEGELSKDDINQILSAIKLTKSQDQTLQLQQKGNKLTVTLRSGSKKQVVECDFVHSEFDERLDPQSFAECLKSCDTLTVADQCAFFRTETLGIYLSFPNRKY